MDCYNYFGYGSFEKFYEEEMEELIECNLERIFYYNDVQYRLAYQWRGTKKNGELLPCLDQSASGRGPENWYRQYYNTWEELFKNARFEDGVKLIEAMARK